MCGDEPDNWQFSNPIQINGKTWKYGPAASRISAKDLGEMCSTIRNEDTTRPVFVNFSCGIANDAYWGRGAGWKNSMYPEYMKSCDVVSFDVYPSSDIGEKFLWFQAKGLDRIKEWAGVDKPRFNCIGPAALGEKGKPTPEQIKAEIWISIIHGSKGIVYFCHNFSPSLQEAALLEYPAMLEAVTKINAQITELAPVINGLDAYDAMVASSNDAVPIDILVKNYKGETYIFAAVMRMSVKPVTGSFQIQDCGAGKVEVLGENRTLNMDGGAFKDEFKKWETHIYKIVKK